MAASAPQATVKNDGVPEKPDLNSKNALMLATEEAGKGYCKEQQNGQFAPSSRQRKRGEAEGGGRIVFFYGRHYLGRLGGGREIQRINSGPCLNKGQFWTKRGRKKTVGREKRETAVKFRRGIFEKTGKLMKADFANRGN